MAKTYGVVLAAGDARRMGKNKMFMRIGHLGVLERSLAAFEQCRCCDRVIIVCKSSDEYEAGCAAEKMLSVPYTIVEGGSERQYSVENALVSITDAAADDVVVIHDGARCFIESGVIAACIEKARETGAAAAGVKSKDTIKTIDGDIITSTLNRAHLVNIQTPQAFLYSVIMDAHKKAKTDGFLGTDECVLLERQGRPISFVESHYDNIKITTQDDIVHGRHIVGERIRTGTGYDAHRLIPDRPLVLGGVEIAHTHGLLGHSDADVLLHAIMDAMLGAAAAGDIGTHFPCTDTFKNISSLTLLEQTRDIVAHKGFTIVNIDATVVAERPKLAPHIDGMRQNIAHTLHIAKKDVSVKATTTEGMGFEGEQKGISAMAVATLRG